jgi:L-threonylcarbamoyladenylate synthase
MLARRFWPGPLTLVLPRTVLVSDLVTGGLSTVAIRMPDHPVALSLIRNLDAGIVGPSANVSGRPSPTSARHVLEDLSGRVDVVIDAGPTRIGVESTVVDVTVDPPAILRVGGLTLERIQETIGQVQVTATEELRRRSPGTRYRHYAPSAQVVLVDRGDGERMERLIREFKSAGKSVACIVHSVQLTQLQSGYLFRFLPADVNFLARNLYRTFRELDSQKVDVILAEAVEEEGLGAAVMDRLRRAAASAG